MLCTPRDVVRARHVRKREEKAPHVDRYRPRGNDDDDDGDSGMGEKKKAFAASEEREAGEKARMENLPMVV